VRNAHPVMLVKVRCKVRNAHPVMLVIKEICCDVKFYSQARSVGGS
jgi:hypothetical protein